MWAWRAPAAFQPRLPRERGRLDWSRWSTLRLNLNVVSNKRMWWNPVIRAAFDPQADAVYLYVADRMSTGAAVENVVSIALQTQSALCQVRSSRLLGRARTRNAGIPRIDGCGGALSPVPGQHPRIATTPAFLGHKPSRRLTDISETHHRAAFDQCPEAAPQATCVVS